MSPPRDFSLFLRCLAAFVRQIRVLLVVVLAGRRLFRGLHHANNVLAGAENVRHYPTVEPHEGRFLFSLQPGLIQRDNEPALALGCKNGLLAHGLQKTDQIRHKSPKKWFEVTSHRLLVSPTPSPGPTFSYCDSQKIR